MTGEPLLEVIALDARDAEHAQAGGADRLELVADMAADGLAPPVPVVREVLAATDLPVRVMLRTNDSFVAGDLDGLCRLAVELAAAGAREFVLGFLTPSGGLDLDACGTLADAVAGCAWTLHRAVDHARDVRQAHADATALTCDTVLSAGSPAGVPDGLPVLRAVAARTHGPRLLVGGGLQAEHVAPLRAAGASAFHVGGGVRPGGWTTPIDVAAVRRWAGLIRA
jgi:copper homeostasis protein